MAAKVSVITALYNHERYIAQAIESVLAQTYSNVEHIIWDDGSQDGGLEIARSYARKNPGRVIVYQHEGRKNLGQEATRNEALKVISGEFVCLLDSDDYWLPKKVELQVAKMESDEQIGLVYTEPRILLQAHNEIISPKENSAAPEGLVFNELVRSNFIHACGVMIRKKSLAAAGSFDLNETGVGPFETRYGAIGEYPLWLKISRQWKTACVREPLAVWRVHGANTGTKRRIQGRRELVDMVGRFLADPVYREAYGPALRQAQDQYLYDLAVILAEDGGAEGRGEAKRLFKGILYREDTLFRKKSLIMLMATRLGGWAVWWLKFIKRILLVLRDPKRALLVNAIEG